MAYEESGVQVFQDLTVQAASNPGRRGVHVAGGNAFLVRYADASERELGRLGYYDGVYEQPFEWPHRPAGGVIDPPYTKLFVKDALLQFFDESITTEEIAKTAGSNNRVTATTVNFATNGDYARDERLLSRDVQPGDVVKVRGISGGNPVTLWSYVRDLIGDVVDAVVGAATVDASNAAADSADAAIEQTAGSVNEVEATVDGASYDGRADGCLTETYTIRVVSGSVGGDLSTAVIRVTSASGLDDVLSTAVSDAGSPTLIGTRGLGVTFDLGAHVGPQSFSVEDLLVGQVWEATVAQAWTQTTATKGGTYSSSQDTTYIIEVMTGGAYEDLPQISVTTTNGVDRSGPTVVATGVPVNVGTRGVEITLAASAGLRKGDKFYVPVTGIVEGPLRTLVLGHSLGSGIAAESALDLTIYLRKPLLEVPMNRTDHAPNTNWDVGETEITINTGIIAYDADWTDNGVQQELPVVSNPDAGYGLMYVQYRAWDPTLAYDVTVLYTAGDLDLIPGSLTPDNPLKQGAADALIGSNGTPVLATAVAKPDDPTSWIRVLDLLTGRDDVIAAVPLTRDGAVLNLYAAHVNDMSEPIQGLWRRTFFSLAGVPNIPVVSAGSTVPGYLSATTSDGDPCLCTFSDDTETDGSQYTILQNPSGNGNFHTNDVRPGDVVRALYVNDGFGGLTWSEYQVDEVISEDEIRLMSGPDAPMATSSMIEIWRALTATEEAAAIASHGGAWGSRRIVAIWPDVVEVSGTLKEGYFAAALVAGQTTGVRANQGLTRYPITGITDVPRTTRKFNRAQLNAMSGSGVWVITQDPRTGNIFTRQAVTTGAYADLNQRDEMFTRNIDDVCYQLRALCEPYIGVTNATQSMADKLRVELLSKLIRLTSAATSPQLGAQLSTASIVQCEVHPTLKDRFLIIINATLPYSTNNIEIHLVA